MSFPIQALNDYYQELGFVVAVLIGFGFGFVLERAGFGRSTKLAAQFYFRDMTVFKVMFSAIVTAMLGLSLLAGVGLVDLSVVSQQVASWTYLWPMVVGGLLLGAGFIISGYCPGTSIVGAASGHIDAVVTFVGVIAGSVIYSFLQPSIVAFHNSGELGHVFLYKLLGVPVAFVVIGVVIMAIASFMGAEKVERIFAKDASTSSPSPRRWVFAGFGLASTLVLITFLIPNPSTEASAPVAEMLSAPELARRVLDEPWRLRVIDVRSKEACAEKRVPGSECVPAEALDGLGLAYAPAHRDLVIVTEGPEQRLPDAALTYHGRVYVLEDGFEGWKAFALTEPEPVTTDETEEQRMAFLFRSSVVEAMTGQKQAPPPAPTAAYIPKKKATGGCN